MNVCVRITGPVSINTYCGFLIVILSSTNPNVTFRGFIIQARTQPSLAGAGNDIVGSFIIVDNETRVQECQLSAEDPVSPTVSTSRVSWRGTGARPFSIMKFTFF